VAQWSDEASNSAVVGSVTCAHDCPGYARPTRNSSATHRRTRPAGLDPDTVVGTRSALATGLREIIPVTQRDSSLCVPVQLGRNVRIFLPF
jgi:hypothetical protein